MHKFNLIESFEIDGGAISGLTQEACFVLGVEWGKFFEKIKLGFPFDMIVHADNADRLVSLAEKRGRFVEHRLIGNGWASIWVGNHSR